MKKPILIFILLIIFLVGCNDNSKTAFALKGQDIEASHKYINGELEGTIKIPSQYEKDGFQIKTDLYMAEEKEEIKDIKLESYENKYIFKSKLPSEGRWNIQYTIKYKEQTLIKNYTDVFGEKKIDLDEIEYLKIVTEPETITPNEEVNFLVSLLNEDGGIIKNSEVILQLEKDDIEFIDSLQMEENDKGIYEVKTKLPENGIYKMTIHINYIKGHKMESMELIVGKNEEKES
ncbi:hypothetical protein ACWM35_11070 [Neobacillus sp. K501]